MCDAEESVAPRNDSGIALKVGCNRWASSVTRMACRHAIASPKRFQSLETPDKFPEYRLSISKITLVPTQHDAASPID